MLSDRLRKACSEVRRKNYPLADLIPLMQESADALDDALDGLRHCEFCVPPAQRAIVRDAIAKLKEVRRDWC